MNVRTLQEVHPETLKEWLDREKAVLIDVREPSEYVREHIPGSRPVPLSTLHHADFTEHSGKIAVFQCRTGNRTGRAADQLLSTPFDLVYHLAGGIEAWKRFGMPTQVYRNAPMDFVRQTLIAAGSLVVLGVMLAMLVSPEFIMLSGLVGTGLVFAGLTGYCPMAQILSLMPWNRRAVAPVLAQSCPRPR